jgi:hypothetical protein
VVFRAGTVSPYSEWCCVSLVFQNGKSIQLVVLYLACISELLLLLYVSDFVSCKNKAFIIIMMMMIIIIICQLLGYSG